MSKISTAYREVFESWRRQARVTLRYCTEEQLEEERQSIEKAKASGRTGWATRAYEQALKDIKEEWRGK